MYFVTNYINSEKAIPVVSTKLELRDYLGTIMARWSINRNNYKITPGIYAVGNPDKNSEVFVTSNYKLSFDHLRKNLTGINAWILILNTKGINVWCAAGKGTFGTKELISKINDLSLNNLVEHKRIIVPQLGAVGISAHEVKKETGFNIKYGPVKASDIREFISNNFKADKKMRTVNFGFYDRLILTPVEIVMNFKYWLILFSSLFIISCLSKNGFSIDDGWNYLHIILTNLGGAYIIGTIITPALLPYIPISNFSFKGLILGAVYTTIITLLNLNGNNVPEIISWFFINLAIASFTAMNFTGASTFTSLSGVKKEMRIALPIQIGLFVIGLITWIILRFI
jgi:hypothetical protein